MLKKKDKFVRKMYAYKKNYRSKLNVELPYVDIYPNLKAGMSIILILSPITITNRLHFSLEMDDSQFSEVASGSNSTPRPISGSSPSPLYAAPSPSASRPLSPGGKLINLLVIVSPAYSEHIRRKSKGKVVLFLFINTYRNTFSVLEVRLLKEIIGRTQ